MTPPISPVTESRHLSWQKLCLAFLLALLLFMLMRWQPELWLQHEIDQQALHHGVDIHYASLHIEGLSVRLEHLSVQAAHMPSPVVLDSLSISTAWASLFTGIAAASVHAEMMDQSAEAVLAWQGGHIVIHDLNAVLEVVALQSYWKQRLPLPVDAGGQLRFSGTMQLDAVSGLPVTGQLKVRWQQATIALPMFDKPLGDYQLTLNTAENIPGHWQWLLTGGTVVALSGSGQLDLSGTLPQQWTINGRVQIQAAPEARALASMLGNQAKSFSISGKLFNVRVQPVSHKPV